MENSYNMTNNNDINKALEIIKDFKNHSNQDLVFAMETINKDFEYTKDTLIKLTHHLDRLELTYNTILKEYQQRTKSV
jgi:prefoldin subunit 5